MSNSSTADFDISAVYDHFIRRNRRSQGDFGRGPQLEMPLFRRDNAEVGLFDILQIGYRNKPA